MRGACPCCGRDLPLTFHHLIPRKLHRRGHFKRSYSKDKLAEGVYMCRDCHDAVHRRYSEMDLGKRFCTLESLLQDETLARHFAWLSRQRRLAN